MQEMVASESTTHTPAPWMVTDTGAGYSVTRRYETPDRSPGFEHEAVAVVHGEANANLIAAAPLLCDALEELLGATNNIEALGEWSALGINHSQSATTRARVDATIANARAAVRAARGEGSAQ